MAEDGDGTTSTPRLAGSFRTPASQAAPQPLGALRVDPPAIGPDRVTVAGVGQVRAARRACSRLLQQFSSCDSILTCSRIGLVGNLI